MKTKNEFKKFYEKYYRYVFVLVVKKVPNKEDVEEIIAEVFISLWKMSSNLTEDANVSALVFTITKNKVNDFLRKKYRLEYIHKSFSEEDEVYINNNAKYSITNKSINEILVIVERLEQKYKELYILKYQQNLSNSEIAKIMNITKNYVKVLNNRLIQKIKKEWKKKIVLIT